MFNFLKNRRQAQHQRNEQERQAQETEQQRKIEGVIDAQQAVMELQARVYGPDRPQTLADELVRISANIEQGRRDDRG